MTGVDLALPTDLVLARSRDGVGRVTLNNAAKRNAITMAMWEAMAAAFAANAPVSMRASKLTIDHLRGHPAQRGDALIEELGRVCARSEDLREGQRAFREKRAPVFTGR